MATDQQAFDEALADFITDLDAGIAAIEATIEAIPGVDLTNELNSLRSAKNRFDTAVEEITNPTGS